jgi:hypothetical protein
VRKRNYISVRAETFEKIRELARKNGEQISTTIDGLIRRYLDEKAKQS